MTNKYKIVKWAPTISQLASHSGLLCNRRYIENLRLIILLFATSKHDKKVTTSFAQVNYRCHGGIYTTGQQIQISCSCYKPGFVF